MNERSDDTLRSLLAHALRDGRSKPPCSYREFLERYLIIPDGKYKDLPFRIDRQPVIGLWIDAIDSGDFTEFYFTAPSQFGKSLIAFVGPVLWHTCELMENYVLGVPFADMASNKWEADILPVMESSPDLRKFKPIAGTGSGGGKVKDMITLRHGTFIKLMSAGGQDSSKAGFTSRVLGVTEAARFSSGGDSSIEADPLRQLRARQRSYGERERRTYVEGTLTVATDLPWRIKPISTDSQIVTPCPHCERWVAPERDSLVGWSECRSENEAGDRAYWSCPVCGERINEDARRASLLEAKLIHRGQSVDKQGRVSGDAPDTLRLFFRAAAFHNQFLAASDIGRDEWRAEQIPEDSAERHSADRELCQFVHCVPYTEPAFADDLVLDKKAIAARRTIQPMNILPRDTTLVNVGTDCGEKRVWWLALARRERDSGTPGKPLVYRHIPAYGEIAVPQNVPLREGLHIALEQLHTMLAAGFPIDGVSSKRMPDQWWIDCNWETDAVLAYVRKVNQIYGRPHKYQRIIGSQGRGSSQLDATQFSAPRKTGNIVRDIDPHGLWYLELHQRSKTYFAIWDSDRSKREAQHALTLPDFPSPDADQTPGSVTLYAGTPKIHERFAQHVHNERLETERTVRGEQQKWKRHGANHLLDCLAAAFRAESRALHIARRLAGANSSDQSSDWYGQPSSPSPSAGNWYEQ